MKIDLLSNAYRAMCICFLIGGSAEGSLVLGYAAVDVNANLMASTVGSGVTGSDLSRIGVVNAGGGGVDYNLSNWAFDGSDYLAWAFTSTLSYDLDSLKLRVNRSNTGPGELRLELATNGGVFQIVGNSLIPALVPTASAATDINFSLAAFDNVTSGAFRLFGLGATSSVGTFRIKGDSNFDGSSNDLVVSGTLSSVPEPGSMALAGLAAFIAGISIFRRKRPSR